MQLRIFWRQSVGAVSFQKSFFTIRSYGISYYSAELEVYVLCQQRNTLRPEETIVPYSKSVLISASFLQNKLPCFGELFRIPFSDCDTPHYSRLAGES